MRAVGITLREREGEAKGKKRRVTVGSCRVKRKRKNRTPYSRESRLASAMAGEGAAARPEGLAVGAMARRRAKLTEKAKLRPHNTMRKKLPDGTDLLDKVPARDAAAKEGDARAESRYCEAIDKVRRWRAHGWVGSHGGMPGPLSTRASGAGPRYALAEEHATPTSLSDAMLTAASCASCTRVRMPW